MTKKCLISILLMMTVVLPITSCAAKIEKPDDGIAYSESLNAGESVDFDIGEESSLTDESQSDDVDLSVETEETTRMINQETQGPAIIDNNIKLNTANISLSVGETKNITATSLPSGKVNTDIIFRSENNAIADINAHGLVVGKTTGTVTITAALSNNKSVTASCTVTVTQPATDILLSENSISIVIAQRTTLGAVIQPSGSTDKNIKYTTSDSNIVTVDSKGNIIGISSGTATINVSIENNTNVRKTCTVNVSEGNQQITWKDQLVEERVRQLLQKSSGAIYPKDVVSITELDLSANSEKPYIFTTLDDLYYFTNLKSLDISAQNIEKVSKIPYLPFLEKLSIKYPKCILQNLNIISQLTNLKYLDLFQCGNLKDISALENTKDLTYLNLTWLYSCSDFSVLSKLTKLQVLIMETCNRISDISMLENLTELRELSLRENSIKDFTPLRNLKKLEKLYLYMSVEVEDLSPLSELYNLTHMDIYCQKDISLSPLGSLNNLKELFVIAHRNDDVTINTIVKLNKLEKLHFDCLQKLTDDQKNRISSALPHCKIEY